MLGDEDEIDAIIALKDQGVDVNCCDALGNTPLMYAAMTGKPMAMCALKKAGANFDHMNKDGQTALRMLLSDKDRDFSYIPNKEALEVLFDNRKVNFDVMHYVADQGNASVAKFLLNRGYVPTNKDVFQAMQSRNESVMKLFVEKCDDIFSMHQEYEFLTPLQYAVANQISWAAKALVEKERYMMDTNEEDIQMQESHILHFALGRNFIQCSKTLLDAGISFSDEDFLKRIITLCTADDAPQEDVDVMNDIIKRALQENFKGTKPSIQKWKVLLPHIRNEKVQVLMDDEVVDLLKKSFLGSNELEQIINRRRATTMQEADEVVEIANDKKRLRDPDTSPDISDGRTTTSLKRTTTIRPFR